MTNTNNHARVAVVTGASSGIGEATARALAAGGYRVALLARRVDRIAAIADALDNGSIAIQADVTDRDSVLAAAERVQQELGSAKSLDDRLRASRAFLPACLLTPSSRCLKPS